MKRFFRIFFALASGILIGGMLTAKLSDGYLWWLGALAGGTMAWLIVDSRSLIAAIPKAWERARGWRPTKRAFVATVHALQIWNNLFLLIYTVSFVLIIFVVIALLLSSVLELSLLSLVAGIKIIQIIHCSCTGAALIVTFTASFCVGDGERERLRDRAWRWNIVSLFVYQVPRLLCLIVFCAVVLLALLPNLIRYGVPQLLLAVGKVPFFLAKFAYELYKLAHTEERMICFVDTALGVSITYLLGSSLPTIMLVAVLGGIFGYFNVKVVKEQWLPRVDAKIQQFFGTVLVKATG